jgi:hypothetical protein
MLTALQRNVVQKIGYYCSGIYYDNSKNKKYGFVDIVNECLTPEDASEYHKLHPNLLWNESCSLLILEKILGVDSFDVMKLNSILEMSVESLYEQFVIGSKRFKLKNKLNKIEEDF